MNTAYKVTTGFLLGIILFLLLSHSCDRRKWRKEEKYLNGIINTYANTKPVIDTVWIERVLYDTVRLQYSYRTVDTVYKSESIVGDFGDGFGLEEREYSGTYADSMLVVRWTALVFGELKDVKILPESKYRYPQITVSKTVTIPAREGDQPRVSRERSHFYLTSALYYSERGSQFHVGAAYIIRAKVGLSVGVLQSTNSDNFYYGGGIIFKLR